MIFGVTDEVTIQWIVFWITIACMFCCVTLGLSLLYCLKAYLHGKTELVQGQTRLALANGKIEQAKTKALEAQSHMLDMEYKIALQNHKNMLIEREVTPRISSTTNSHSPVP